MGCNAYRCSHHPPTPELLAQAALRLDGGRLVLRLMGGGVFEGEGVQRRLDHLAATLGVTSALE